MSFPAKFKGKCGECGDAFDVGEEVCYIDGTLVAIHEHGRPEDWELIGSKPENVCRRCYTVHAGECL